MASYYLSRLADGATIDFVPLADVFVIDDPGIRAADLRLEQTADGAGIRFVAGGKTITLDGLLPDTLNASAFGFADGSRVLSLTAQSAGSLAGGTRNDLLIGSAAALPMQMVSVGVSGSSNTFLEVSLHNASADGRFVLFSDGGADIVGGDTNGQIDVFLRDTLNGTSTRVSVTADGAQLSSNGEVFGLRAASVSDDGRTVAFTHFSDAFGGSAFIFDAFVKDLETGSVRLASSASDGTGGNANAIVSSMSGSGRYVAFTTFASNLLGTGVDTNAADDVYVKDTLTGAIARASQAGVQSNGRSTDGQLSRDGRFVAFTSTATNLSSADTDITRDVYLRDMNNGSLSLVSTGSAGKANAASEVQAVSDDGRYVLFTSLASNLAAGDGVGTLNVFLRDTFTGTTRAVDSSAAGVLANGGAGATADLSGDGRYAVFSSSASNLAGPGLPANQIYVKDLLTGALAVVSVDANGVHAQNGSAPRLSADGSQVIFSANGRLDPNVEGSSFAEIYTVANPLLGVTLAGGAGNDSYQIRRATDVVVEAADAGSDTVIASVSYALADNVEKLVLVGSAGISATGNALANVLSGNAGDNLLDGGGGNDTASYAAAAGGVAVGLDLPGVAQDTGGAGIDTLVSIENLVGSAFDDFLLGDDGANVLDGGAGNDVLLGGPGDDVYVVDSALDIFLEDADSGIDTVRAALSHTLAANLENLVLTGGANINATGNELRNNIFGNSGSNRLDGGAGVDTVSYTSARSGVVVGLDRSGPQATGAGIDTLIGFENLSGSKNADLLHGNGAANTLNGDDGIDTLSYARAAGAVTVDLSLTASQDTIGAGSDRLQGFENLSGSGFADSLAGDASNNVLDGGVGADTLSGGAGRDTYLVDNVLDQVVEAGAGGVDTVFSSVSFALSGNLENLVLTGTANLNATGNSQANVLSGNAGANILNGGASVDTVSYADAAGSVSVNLATGIVLGGAGSDSLVSIESVIGSAFGDTIVGNGAANAIRGGAGADTLVGDAGNDSFELSSRASADDVFDFSSGADKMRISMAGIRVGNGDTVIDNAVSLPGASGFAPSAELVIVTVPLENLSIANAALGMATATANYASGQTALFAFHDGIDTGLFHFSSSNTDSTVSAGELTLIATLSGVTATALSDYLFVT